MLNFLTALILTCLLLTPAAFAEKKVDSQKSSTKESLNQQVSQSKKDHRKSRLGVDQSDFMPSDGEFGLILSYSMDYDSLQTQSPETVRHFLGATGTYSFSKNLSAYGSMSVGHETNKFNIVRDNPEDNFHGISNLNMGMVYSLSQQPSWLARNAFTLNVGFPISERSRVNKQFINLSLSNYLQTKSWNRLSIYNRMTANVIGQTLKFSVWNDDGFSGDQLNRDWLVQTATGINVRITQRIGLRSSLNINNVHFLDGTWNLSFGNQTAVFANYFGVQFYAQMFNRSYAENQTLQPLYYDKYRRFFAAGMTYAF